MSNWVKCECGKCEWCLRDIIVKRNEEIKTLKAEIERLTNLIKYIPHRKK